MSSNISDALQNPSKVLSDLYQQHSSLPLHTFPATVTAHFTHIFQSQHALEQIPALDLHHPPESFPPRSLVAFNCMVQDTSLSQDLYLGVKPDGSCGGWGIEDNPALPVADDKFDHANLREASVLWAVSIPGLSDWCHDAKAGAPAQPPVLHQPHKYPLLDVAHVGVQLKIYDENIARPLRTTDLLSFVGILTSEAISSNVIELSHPITVPTLHVLFATPIMRTIIPRSFPEPSILSDIDSLRTDLVDWVAEEGLAGDRLTAEWVLLSAISRTRSRQPPIMPLSLTVTKFPSCPNDPNAVPALYHVLSQIFPLVVTLPLALDTLNQGAFYPVSKDEDLHSGFLQQPKGSLVLITEGAVTEGKVLEQGAKNFLSIQEMMKSQTIDYVYPFSNFSFETDLNFLVTTEGKKSTFFKTDVNIPLRPTRSSGLVEELYKPIQSIRLPPQEKISRFRQLVGGSKIGNSVLAESLSQHVEDDFVRERATVKEETKQFSADDLIIRMVVARLVAHSLHRAEVTIDIWERAKELEKQRETRS
ncbi:hypothetical protein D9613_002856 [Agrocybe pediades]|uniref:Mini-chromosome maintenance complex-binding protein n=1 Tax=Agrocybe pediades TaxID=84607 RepID=A0A8H4QQL8_9AGAR|nr:hypothetical protein D9613_002856 [Agrocybe pediades]